MLLQDYFWLLFWSWHPIEERWLFLFGALKLGGLISVTRRIGSRIALSLLLSYVERYQSHSKLLLFLLFLFLFITVLPCLHLERLKDMLSHRFIIFVQEEVRELFPSLIQMFFLLTVSEILDDLFNLTAIICVQASLVKDRLYKLRKLLVFIMFKRHRFLQFGLQGVWVEEKCYFLLSALFRQLIKVRIKLCWWLRSVNWLSSLKL